MRASLHRAAAVPALLAAMLLTGCRWRAEPLPVLGKIPDFHLTAHTGEPFQARQLDGRIWIASFIFTNCPGPCPRMSAQFRMIQNANRDFEPLTLVNFTVDPERDTPETLAAYARRFQALPGRWYFLTGPVEELNRLCQDAFLLGKVDGKDFEHSTRFVLVDGKRRVRGYYQSALKEEIEKLRKDLRKLYGEKQ